MDHPMFATPEATDGVALSPVGARGQPLADARPARPPARSVVQLGSLQPFVIDGGEPLT